MKENESFMPLANTLLLSGINCTGGGRAVAPGPRNLISEGADTVLPPPCSSALTGENTGTLAGAGYSLAHGKAEQAIRFGILSPGVGNAQETNLPAFGVRGLPCSATPISWL